MAVESFVPLLFSSRYVGWMADDDDIRELIGRLTAAQRQGFHVTPAHIRIVVAALRFCLAGRTWLIKTKADPHDEAPRRKPERYNGPLPTVADSRQLGLVALHVHCEAPHCWHQARFTFDDLGVPDTMLFVDIPKWRSFRCSDCGSRRVSISADWRDVRAQGVGRPTDSP